MSGSATVTVADILELRAAGLTEEETWAVLCQAAQTLQDLFLSKEMSSGKVVPLVSPHTLGINSKGRIVISLVGGIHEQDEPYLAPEYVSAKDVNDLDWEKMWVYSLGKTLLSALKDTLRKECFWVLRFMTAKDSNSRASLMSLLNIISEHCRTNLPVKPFSHLVMEMYREVFGTPPQCLFPLDIPRRVLPEESPDEQDRRWLPLGKNSLSSGSSSGGSWEPRSLPTKKKPVERAPSRLYRGPSGGGRGGGKEGGRRCVGPEFVVRGMEPWKAVELGGMKNSERKCVVMVILLTGQKVRVSCDPQSTTCGRVLEAVVQLEGLEDNYMFGVACLIKGDFVFVPGEMKVHKVAPSGWKEGDEEVRFFLYVRVRFFLPSVRGLRSGRTKHLIYLQLRRSLLEQQIRCEPQELIELAGLALQAEFGNFDEKEHGACSYFLLEHYLPEEVIEDRAELERRLQEQHKSRLGLEPKLAEEIFIGQVQRLPEYGCHHYTALWVRKSVNIPMWVTVNPHGVYLYEKKKNVLERKIHEAFTWKNIQGLTCNERYFRLAPQDVIGRKVAGYKLRMENKKSYFLFRLASLHHQFFLKLRIELSPLDALSQEFGVRVRKEEGRNGCQGEEDTVRGGKRRGVEEQQNKENENPEGDKRREKRRGVRMGVRAFRSGAEDTPGGRVCVSEGMEAYVIEASIRSSSERFAYELEESVSSGLVKEWEGVSWEEERVLRKVRLRKDKYGCFGLEIVEGGNGGLFVENVLKGKGGGEGGGEGEGEGVQRGDQLVSVNGICLLNLNYTEALSVLRGTGNEMEILVSQSCNRQRRQKPVEHEYLKNIRYETANEAENMESELPLRNRMLCWSNEPRKSEETSGSQCAPRLPKIELPSFSGDIRDWEQFYDLFKSLVHENPRLSDMDKLYYLMGCLKGQARNIGAGVAMAPENYAVVWDALVERYQDIRTLANTYLTQILSWKDLRDESEKGLNSFLEEFNSAVRAIKNLKLNDLADFMFLYHALARLNPETVNYFEVNRNSSSVPQFNELVDFIKLRVKTLATTKPKVMGRLKESDGSKGKWTSKSFMVNERDPVAPSAKCGYCGRSGHQLIECKGFISLNPKTRYAKIKELNLCYNCFSADHGVRTCPAIRNCTRCEFKHHEMIHHGQSKEGTPNPGESKKSTDQRVSMYSRRRDATAVLLGTVRVEVKGPEGGGEGRFLLDNGSQANLVSQNFCRRIGLRVTKGASSLQGLGGVSQPVKGRTTFTIRSRTMKGKEVTVSALVVERVTGWLPQSQVILQEKGWLEGLPLADTTFDRPGAVEGVLGAEIFCEILGSDHRRKDKESGPVALETSLGYVITGRIPTRRQTKERRACLSILESPPVEDLVQRFWEMEAVPEALEKRLEDDPCEQKFRQETFRDEAGRFTVALPFKLDPGTLGDSRGRARKRFYALESRLEKNLELREAYHRAMSDFIDQGHIVPVGEASSDFPTYYIPHHAVVKESESTPVRIVLDASAPSDNGLSLNSILHVGPKLQADITALLINFRLFPVAVVSDVRKMYRQIQIVQSHYQFQRIFWRWSPKDPLRTWELRTLAFGVASSPYLALRCVRELLQKDGRDFPKTAELVRSSLYMDDLVVSVPSVEEAEELFSQSVELFRRGQFELAKWVSNSEGLLSRIPSELQAKTGGLVTFGERSELGVLGMVWNPTEDKILFKFPVPSADCTKRSILSSVARCFDPLGLTAPLILYLKVLVKELWSLKLGWDEEAPPSVQRRWRRVHAEWSGLRELEINRNFGMGGSTSVTIFGFADASKDGYGGVVYLQNEENRSTLRLVCAKSRVSPMKEMSIPRLELSAALVLAKLMSHVVSTLEKRIKVSKTFAFSDSSTVLQWLHKESSKDVFIRNRTIQIKELLPDTKWKHIAGKDNPADGLSRGCSPGQLLDNRSWFEGPGWTTMPEAEWPCLRFEPGTEIDVTLAVVHVPAELEERHPLLELVERKSSWSEILRITVWVLRGLKLLPKAARISVADLREAERILVVLVQKKHFEKDLELLQLGKEVSHRLRSLRPFLHNGALRVGGRLENSRFPFDQRHPYILPKAEALTERLVDHYHLKHLHTGAYLVEALIRQRFRILRGKSVIKKRIRACNRCFRLDPKGMEPLMADLPAARVNQAKAFSNTGVDYFGPLNVTMGKRRGSTVMKAYVALFVCMAVKAIHLELVSSLSTEHFLQAFKRFLSRRGPCQTLYSDRGTNFKGAAKVLSELTSFVRGDEFNRTIERELSEQRVEWRFNPAAAPHMGGMWESQVKVVKRHLLRVVGAQLLTYEEWNTVLVQVEGLLNSRPLCPLSSDPAAPSALTPAHFLYQTPLGSLPAEDLGEAKLGHLNRFQLLDHMVQSFWRRWHVEYLTTLQARQKWQRAKDNIRVGTVGVLRLDNTPPLRWPLGVVTEVFPGRDGTVRSLRVRCGSKDILRPAVKFCPLPTQ